MNNKKNHESYIDKNTVQEKLNNLLKKKNEIKLRAQANIENIQKKSEHTINKIKKEHLKNFIKELSSIVEKFHKISDISHQKSLNENSVIQGITLIQKSLLNTIIKNK